MDKVSSIEIEGFGSAHCVCAAAKKSSKCCSNEYKIIKAQDNHTSSSLDVKVDAPVFLFVHPTPSYNFTAPVENAKALISFSDTSPPATGSLPIYISNCFFRILIFWLNK